MSYSTHRAGRVPDTPLLVVSGLLITLYVCANIMAVKLISIGNIPLFDAGTITFPFAYMLGDVLTELWGYRTARNVIWLAFVCNLMTVTVTLAGVWLPYPDYTHVTAQAYAHIFTYVPRIVVASLVGFLLGELSNAWSMEWIKRKTNGKYLWLRTIGSSMVGYIFDTGLFVVLAFAGTVPVSALFSMIAAQYVIKLLIEAICGTPLAYLVIIFIRRRFAALSTTSMEDILKRFNSP